MYFYNILNRIIPLRFFEQFIFQTIISPAYDFSRITYSYTHWWNILGYHTTSTNNRPPANGHSWQNSHSLCKPYIVFYNYNSTIRRISWRIIVVLKRPYIHILSNIHIFSYFHATSSI